MAFPRVGVSAFCLFYCGDFEGFSMFATDRYEELSRGMKEGIVIEVSVSDFWRARSRRM